MKGLVKKYNDKTVVNHLDLKVETGEMLCLLGASGCGKSTTLSMIAGMVTPSFGSISLGDRELTHVPTHKRGVGLVFQNYALFPHLTVFENVAFGLRRHKVPKKDIRGRVEESLTSVQLAEYKERFPHQLSGGQQQRVALARTLVLRPSLVLFDEPLSNLDAKLRQDLGIEILSLQKQFGFTGVFVTHDQEEAMLLGDRIAIMDQGEIVQLGSPVEIYRQPQSPFVADFIGDSNLLDVIEFSQTKKQLCLTLEGGQQVRAISESSKQWSKMMIRPEYMNIIKENELLVQDHSTFNYLKGSIMSINYTGASYLIEVNVTGLPKPVLVRVQNHSSDLQLNKHDSVSLRWMIKDTLVYE